MMCIRLSVIPCFPSGLAESNNIMSKFVLFSLLFGYFKSMVFRKWWDKPCTKAVKEDFFVNFLKVQHRRPNNYQ